MNPDEMRAFLTEWLVNFGTDWVNNAIISERIDTRLLLVGQDTKNVNKYQWCRQKEYIQVADDTGNYVSIHSHYKSKLTEEGLKFLQQGEKHE